MKNKVLSQFAPFIQEIYGKETGNIINEKAKNQYIELCNANKDEPKAVRNLTFKEIYPIISLYKTLCEFESDKTNAFEFMDKTYSHITEKKANSIRLMLKIPGLYKLYPRIFAKVAVKQFGKSAGFEAKFYDAGKKRVKFDMTKCLYCRKCQNNGCPEIVPVFCHTDDVCNADIHPKLKWNRTKIMGDGAELCDFDLYAEEK